MIRPKAHPRFPFRLQALLLAATLLLASCSSRALSAAPAILGAASTVQGSPDSSAVKGRLEPRNYVDLSISETAQVDSILVKEGDAVEKGAVLMRLDSYERNAAEQAAAETERIAAQQALDELYRHAPTSLAQAEATLSQAEREQALAEDHLVSFKRSKDASRIDQARANLLLAEKRMNDTQEDLRKAQQRYDNRHNPIWLFVSRHQYELLLTIKEKTAAYAERRYWDAKQKYDDLLKPPDPIDLALAQARLDVANARLSQAERERIKWLDGPDPDQAATARARLKAAEARLKAAQMAVLASEVITPISGVVVSLDIKQGEQAVAGQQLAVIADLTDWVALIPELGEREVVRFQTGQELHLTLDAYPEAELSGAVESISEYYTLDNTDVFYTAKISLKQTDLPLRWGMTVRIR